MVLIIAIVSPSLIIAALILGDDPRSDSAVFIVGALLVSGILLAILLPALNYLYVSWRRQTRIPKTDEERFETAGGFITLKPKD